MKRQLAASALLTCAVFLLTNVASIEVLSQNTSKNKVVNRQSRAGEPVEVSNLRVKGQPVSFEETIVGDDNWVRDLTVDVKNVSNRDIIYIKVALDFPVDESTNNIYRVALEYGRQPQSKKADSADTPLKPGAVVTLTVKNASAEDLKSYIQTKGVGEALNESKANLFTEMVFFDKNTAWAMGKYITRDQVTNKWVTTGNRIRPIRPDEKTADARFLKLSSVTSTTHASSQEYSCVKGDYAIAECDCGTARLITVAGAPSLGPYYSRTVHELCDPSDRGCGYVDYTGVQGYCQVA